VGQNAESPGRWDRVEGWVLVYWGWGTRLICQEQQSCILVKSATYLIMLENLVVSWKMSHQKVQLQLVSWAEGTSDFS
jgi:hypothetical protein